MKHILLVLIVTILNTKFLFSQTNFSKDSSYFNNMNNFDFNTNQRSVFLFSSIGLIEILSLGVGYQVTENFSLALKWSGTWIGSGEILPNSASGYGIKLSYHKPFLFFNSVTFGYIIYFKSTLDWESIKQPWNLGYEPFIKGQYFDLNIGRETINESGFNFFWAIGFSVSAAKEANILYVPSLKIGLNYDFIRKKSN